MFLWLLTSVKMLPASMMSAGGIYFLPDPACHPLLVSGNCGALHLVGAPHFYEG